MWTEQQMQEWHDQQRAKDPEHDLCSCWCCCWDCGEMPEHEELMRNKAGEYGYGTDHQSGT